MKMYSPSCRCNAGHFGPGSCVAKDRGLEAYTLKQNSCAFSLAIMADKPPACCDHRPLNPAWVLADAERGGRIFPIRSVPRPQQRGLIARMAIFPRSPGGLVSIFKCANAVFLNLCLAWMFCIRQCFDVLNVRHLRDLTLWVTIWSLRILAKAFRLAPRDLQVAILKLAIKVMFIPIYVALTELSFGWFKSFQAIKSAEGLGSPVVVHSKRSRKKKTLVEGRVGLFSNCSWSINESRPLDNTILTH
jgi:hypothetical protein